MVREAMMRNAGSRSTIARLGLSAIPLLSILGLPEIAQAQTESVLIQPRIPLDYSRGRNVSVRERRRPDYDPLGVRVGGLLVFPSIQIGGGYSDNASLSQAGGDDGFVSTEPKVEVKSNWSRHEMLLSADMRLLRYFNQTTLNQTAYDIGGTGRLDVNSRSAIYGEARLEKKYESPTDGQVDSDIAVLSSYQRASAGLRGEVSSGRMRYAASLDFTDLNFDNIDLPSGGRRIQRDRDRRVTRVSGRAEYAISPSFAFYGQLDYDRIDYDTGLSTGGPNRDSDGVRAVGGVSMDLQGLMRGTVGVGYVNRSYDASIYPKVDGLSVGARLEYFLTELTTLTGTANRTIQDSSFSANSAYYDNRFSLRVDHELLRNLILSGYAEYAHIDYIDSPLKNDTYRFIASGKYMASRKLGFDLSMAYAKQDSNASAVTGRFNELRIQVGVTVQR